MADPITGLLANFAGNTRVEFRSALSPPVSVSVNEALGPGSNAPAPFYIQWLKPTVSFITPAGAEVIAPYGAAGYSGGFALAAIAVGLVGLGYLLGRKT